MARPKYAVGDFVDRPVATGSADDREPGFGSGECQIFGVLRAVGWLEFGPVAESSAKAFEPAARSATARDRIVNDASVGLLQVVTPIFLVLLLLGFLSRATHSR